MDLVNRRQCNAFFPDALALLNHLPYHSKGDPEHQMDGNLFSGSYGGGNNGLLFVPSGRAAVGIVGINTKKRENHLPLFILARKGRLLVVFLFPEQIQNRAKHSDQSCACCQSTGAAGLGQVA